jgi:hypothetical protein
LFPSEVTLPGLKSHFYDFLPGQVIYQSEPLFPHLYREVTKRPHRVVVRIEKIKEITTCTEFSAIPGTKEAIKC